MVLLPWVESSFALCAVSLFFFKSPLSHFFRKTLVLLTARCVVDCWRTIYLSTAKMSLVVTQLFCTMFYYYTRFAVLFS
jgi:hypothetical protein